GLVARFQRRDLRWAQGDGQQTVLDTVVRENVCERWGEDDAESVIAQRPYRVLARRAAAKIFSRKKDARAAILRRVQRKVLILFPLGIETPVIKQAVTVAGPRNALQELLGDDLVGVDVVAVQKRDDPGM